MSMQQLLLDLSSITSHNLPQQPLATLRWGARKAAPTWRPSNPDKLDVASQSLPSRPLQVTWFQFTNPGETYPASRLLYDAAGILGGGSLPRAFESAPRAAFASTLSSVESTIKAFAAVQTYAHMTSDPAAESDSKIETKA